MIFFISLFKITSVVMIDPKIFFWVAASVADAAAVNPHDIWRLLTNDKSTFFFKDKATFVNGPRKYPNCTILDIWVFDNFMSVVKSLGKYSRIYSKFLLIGDFNAEESEPVLAQFLHNYNAVNIIYENTCYKSITNSSCIDLIITKSHNNFQSTSTFCKGLSDFHKLALIVLTTSFRKTAPKEIHYRN